MAERLSGVGRSRLVSVALGVMLALGMAGGMLVSIEGVAEARSGSSARGGSFSSGSSSSSSSSGSYESSSSSSYTPPPPSSSPSYESSSSSSYSSSGSAEEGDRIGFIILSIVLLISLGPVLIAVAVNRYKSWKESRMSVLLLEIGVRDPDRELQRGLAKMVRRSSLSSQEKLFGFYGRALTEIQNHLERVDCGRSLYEKTSAEKAEPIFEAWAATARGKYDREVERRTSSRVERARQRDVETDGVHDEDGDFFVHEYMVISLVVAWQGEPFSPGEASDRAALGALIERLFSLPMNHLRVVELIWSPAAESDDMDEVDMGVTYPELVPFG